MAMPRQSWEHFLSAWSGVCYGLRCTVCHYTLKIVSLYLFFLNDYILSSFKSTFRNGLSFMPPCQSFASLQRGSKYELIYWSVLPCANFFIFYIYYLHMWSSCVMTFLVKRKFFETCTAKIKFEEIIHGQTYFDTFTFSLLTIYCNLITSLT